MTYAEAKAVQASIDADVSRLSAALKGFPTGSMGLTPDTVKVSPAYRAAKTEYDLAFQRLRSCNYWFTRTFKREIAEERRQRRDALASTMESA